MSNKERRVRVFNQLMVQLSIFDMIGSIAYALTSLPIPAEYFYYGSYGNDATCTTQGFFIQVGTISCYTNVSLAVYYYLVIQLGFSETAVKKVRIWLLILPIVVGMIFALAGKFTYNAGVLIAGILLRVIYLPIVLLSYCRFLLGISHYGNLILWCNNTANWWPDIMVAVAIVASTIIMGRVIWSVYKKEQASKKWRGKDAKNTMTGKVFWQSFWFLM